MIALDIGPFEMGYGWFAPFYYRKPNERFTEFFSGNGYYPYDGNYNTNIRVNLKVFLDENGRVDDMSYYKVYDFTQGHGKPVTRDAELTPFDEKKLVSALSVCTISTAEDELAQLLKKAENEKLPDGWKILKTTKRSIIFVDKKGNEQSVSCSRIAKAIDISHAYLDILTRKEFWLANSKYLKVEDFEPLHALFSLIDATTYYKYNLLVSEAQKRLWDAEKNSRLDIINLASENGDIKTLQRELRHIQQESLQPEDLAKALYNSIVQRNVPMAQYLLKNGADVNSAIMVNGKNQGIMSVVIENELDSLFNLCLKSGLDKENFWTKSLVGQAFRANRQDYAFKLLNAGIPFFIIDETVKTLDLETLKKLLKYKDTVTWHTSAIDVLYKSGELIMVKKILKQLHSLKESQLADTVRWLLDTGDIKLMSIYIDQKYPCIPHWPWFYLKNTSCYSPAWTQFYKVDVLFKDERTYEIFLSQSIKECIKHQDCKGVYYLLVSLHAIPDEGQMKSIITMIRNGSVESDRLFDSLLKNLHFEDDGEWHGNTCYSLEERHNMKVSNSAALFFLVWVLKSNDSKNIRIVIDTQQDLFAEPAAFQSIYNAAKDISDQELQYTIYHLLQPAVKIIIETWGEPHKFLTLSPINIENTIIDAKHCLELIKE